MRKRTIVLSGVNLIDGGPLSVYKDFLSAIIEGGYAEKNNVIALIGNKELFKEYSDHIQLVEYKASKKSWLIRLYLEYIGFYRLSRRLDVFMWISMHDTTPNVKAKHKYVYCHNSSPFNSMKLSEIKYGYKYYLFSKFYKYLYRINIHKNDAVIVQQNWLKKEFEKMYGLKRVIVARPSLPNIDHILDTSSQDETIFIYPSYPRYYKNFQTLCEAVKILEPKKELNFRVIITLDGRENKYASDIIEKYGQIEKVSFCGLLTRDSLFKLYGRSNCLVFISKLESWGLPITEYKVTGKPMILADLPYAHDNIADYKRACFVNPDDPKELAQNMYNIIKGKQILNSVDNNELPDANNWDELCLILFGE